MLGNTIYTKEEIRNLNDDEIIKILKEYWNINYDEPIEVIGELSRNEMSSGDYHHRINNIKLIKTFSILEYPIKDLELKDSIIENGIYVPLKFDKAIKELLNNNLQLLVMCNLTLASESQRLLQNNPFLLNVISPTIRTYTNINETLLIKDSNNILIKDSIINSIKHEYKNELSNYKEEYIQEIEDKIKVIENSTNLKIEDLKNLNKEVFKQQEELKKIGKVFGNISMRIQEKENYQKELVLKIQQTEEIMAKKLDKLREFIKIHVDRLLELEFIDEEEYKNVLMINDSIDLENDVLLNFQEDLGSDKQKAISHIQAYLFNKDVIYPRYILEDFFALIQTNDLIILAGESGSGKTNLVKSFADAIGGKAKIIPVKPNWTSAEDLLGYYNPLEKKYLATPFLEAIIEAQNNPTIPYFICLDEMNLARVEYYFADFLSLLEERNELPEIKLYSEDETSHTLSELKNVLELIESTKEKYQKKNIVNFVKLLQDEEINKELTRVFGFSDKDSLIKYHTDLRRMINGILNIPSSIIFPKNVRIIGAINIDETTHYLSPKILDRAHIMKFDSPLLFNWSQITDEIEENKNKNLKIKFTIEELGLREQYPSFNKEDEFCKTIIYFTKKYFNPMGIEVGLRTIRQGLNYKKIFLEQNSDERLVINNFILHKILPKMTFDGSKKVIVENIEKDKSMLLSDFMNDLRRYVDVNSIQYESNDSIKELEHIIKNSKNNSDIVNYWA